MSANTDSLMAAIANCGGAVKDRKDENKGFMAGLSGPAGSTFRLKGTDASMGLITPEQMPSISFATTEAELTQAKSAEEDFKEVFNSWTRFSHRSGYPQPAFPAELSSWELMPDNSIRSTVNSSSIIGFVSPEKFKDYTFTADVSSTSNDDDYIGLVVAAAEVDGRLHTLSAIRSGGGNRLWQLMYNYGQSSGRQLLGGSFGMEFPDGVINDSRTATVNNEFGSWTSVPYGARIRAVRSGQYIRCYTTNYFRTADPTITYHAAANGVIDLNSHADFEKFRDGASIGYVCSSQANSTWKVIERPQSRKDIVDARDGVLWRWNNETNDWMLMGQMSNDPDFVKGSFYYSPVNDQIYYVEYSGQFRRLR